MIYFLMIGAWHIMLVAVLLLGITVVALIDILRSDFTGRKKLFG